MSSRTGRCLCGAVSFSFETARTDFGACHCAMCRRWTGSAFLGISVPDAAFQLTGEASVRTRQTSSWAERAWCDACGSGLWYRITKAGRFGGSREIPIGLLDDASGLEFVRELFIDEKPDSYAYQGEHKLLTRAKVARLFRIDLDAE